MTVVPRQQSALFGSRGYRNHNAALSHSQIMETLFRTSYWAMYGIIYLPCPRQRIKMMKEPRDAVRIRRVSRRKWCTSLMRTLIDPDVIGVPHLHVNAKHAGRRGSSLPRFIVSSNTKVTRAAKPPTFSLHW